MDAVDLRMDIAKTRALDATLKVTGALVLRPQSQGEVASLMGGIVRSLLVKDGQSVRRGQVMAMIENTDVVSLQREYYSAYKESEMARLELERQRQLSSKGAGVGKNLQQAEKNFHHGLPPARTHIGHREPSQRVPRQLCRHADAADEDTRQQCRGMRPERV